MATVFAEDPCPFGAAVEILLPRWTSHILWVLTEHGTLRFSEIRTLIPDITPKVLTTRLRGLERDGLVERVRHAEVPPRVEYATTDLADTLRPVFGTLANWTDRYSDEVSCARDLFDART